MIRKQIACSIFAIILSAGAAVTGTFAWFTSIQHVEVSMSNIAAVNPERYQLEELNLYKFVYPTVKISETESYVDYLDSESGVVTKYLYEEEQCKFGLLVDGAFEERDASMNLYDPLDQLINHSTLLSMNTNIIYEAKIRFLVPDTRLVVESLLREITLGSGQIKATECLEFDVYLDSDLSSESLITDGFKNYYPSYLAQSSVLTEGEEIYHKLSYLASLEDSEHSNFFGEETTERISLYDGDCVLDDDDCVTVYINVNYNVEKLTSYIDAVRMENLVVVDDYMFRFGYGG